MPTLERFPSAESGDWSYATRMYLADDSFAYSSGSSSLQHYYNTLSTFGVDENLPLGAVVTRVDVEARYYIVPFCRFYLWAQIDGSPVNSDTYGTSSEATTLSLSFTSGSMLTRSNLTNDKLSVKISKYGLNSSRNGYCDYVKITTTYVLPTGIEMGCVF